MLRILCVGLACAGASSAACAADSRPDWTVGVAAFGSQSETDGNPTTTSGSISLERLFDNSWIGGAIGGSSGQAPLPEIATATDQSGWQGQVWWGGMLGDYSLQLDLGYDKSTASGSVTAGPNAPPAFAGLAIDVSGDVKTSSAGLTLSRSFGDRVTVTPALSVSYDKTTTDLSVQRLTGAVINSSKDEDGVTGSLWLDLAGPVSNSVNWSFGGAFFATSNAAAQGFISTGSGARPVSRLEEGSAQWGDVHGGLGFALGANTQLRGIIGTSFGRDDDEAYASISLAHSF